MAEPLPHKEPDLKSKAAPGSELKLEPQEGARPESPIDGKPKFKSSEEIWTRQRIIHLIMATLGSVLSLISLRAGLIQASVPPPRTCAPVVRTMDSDETDTALEKTIKRLRSILPDIAGCQMLQEEAGKLLKQCIVDLESTLIVTEAGRTLWEAGNTERLLDNLIQEVRQPLKRSASSIRSDPLDQLQELVGAISEILEDYERIRKGEEGGARSELQHGR